MRNDNWNKRTCFCNVSYFYIIYTIRTAWWPISQSKKDVVIYRMYHISINCGSDRPQKYRVRKISNSSIVINVIRPLWTLDNRGKWLYIKQEKVEKLHIFPKVWLSLFSAERDGWNSSHCYNPKIITLTLLLWFNPFAVIHPNIHVHNR